MNPASSNRDWLSLSAIARRWGAETGQAAEEIERELEAWFAEFVERERPTEPGASAGGKDTTNRLMGLLGGRYMVRETLETFCEESGRDKPRFWFAEDRTEQAAGAGKDAQL